MTAWEELLDKGTGATAYEKLTSDISETVTWDALLEKSTATLGSTAWAHLISALAQAGLLSLLGTSQIQRIADNVCVLYQTEEEFLNRVRSIRWVKVGRNSFVARIEPEDCD